jgi:hypothetical protein
MSRAPGTVLRAAACWVVPPLVWVIPPLVCVLLYWRGFLSWFRADDFAWLGGALHVSGLHDWIRVLFTPEAQGTIRPWSEPGFFIAGYKLFGLNSLPFRIVIFGTHIFNLALVTSIGARLTGMRAAGFWAAAFWAINGSLVEPLGWACTYNQVMCGAFLLLALHFLLRYTESGERRFYVYQWITFVLGFGALEINVVYPVLAAGYTYLCARKYFLRMLPLTVVSGAYAAAHLAVAPAPRSGPYAMHFASMARTLATYWTWSVGPTHRFTPFLVPPWLLPGAIGLITTGLAAFVLRNRRAGYGVKLFCLLWFLATIAPVLPLRDHTVDYYVYLPVIGLCWLGGWAFAAAWQSGRWAAAAATTLVALYAFMAAPQAAAGEKWNYDLTMRTRAVVQGVAQAHVLYPDRTILLDRVDSTLFADSVRHRPFLLAGTDRVFLTPGTSSHLRPDLAAEAAGFELPAEVAGRALREGKVVVYDTGDKRLRNVTAVYSLVLSTFVVKPPAVVEAADPLNAYLLGPEWYHLDENHRWMPQRASLRMAAPQHAGEKLYLQGGTAHDLFAHGPVTVRVAVNGRALPPATLDEGQEEFELSFPLPGAIVGQPVMNVSLEVSRTFRAGVDERDLGLYFGEFAVR